jgi:hypothetical protein
MVSTKAAVSIYKLQEMQTVLARYFAAHFTVFFARHVGGGFSGEQQGSLQSKQLAAAQVRIFFDEQYCTRKS